MDKISFKGIQNIGAMSGRFVLDANEPFQKPFNKVVMQLTGKDISDFADVFEKFPDKNNANFINFNIVDLTGYKTNGKKYVMFLNDRLFKLDDKNISILQRLNNLYNKLLPKQNSDFKISKNYIESETSYNNLFDYVAPEKKSDAKGLLKLLHAPQNVKK